MPEPAWLRTWLGDDFFIEVFTADMDYRPITDSDVAQLVGLNGTVHDVDSLRWTELCRLGRERARQQRRPAVSCLGKTNRQRYGSDPILCAARGP